jgi:hypothetical protein
VTSAAQQPGTPVETAILIRNTTVIGGTVADPRSGMDVVIRDGLIESIEESRGEYEFDGRVIEGQGTFLIPGLIDAHVHLSGSGQDATDTLLRWTLEGGVTSLRDMAGDARALAGIQRAQIVGELPGPSLYYSALMAGPAFMNDPRLEAATVGYESGEAPYMVPLTEETDLARTVAMLKGTGATGVKLYADLSGPVVAAVTREAHRAGLQVWGHSAIFPAKPIEILDSGVDGVSHAPYVIWEAESPTSDFTLRARGDFERIPADGPDMDRVIDAMVRNGTVMDPTLFVFNALGDHTAEQRLQWGADFTRRAFEAGVIIAAGTDRIGRPVAGALPNVHAELELLVELAGLSPRDALKAGTLGGARAIGVADRVGTVEQGKVADLVLLSADPTEDIRNTRTIVHVIQGGRVIR